MYTKTAYAAIWLLSLIGANALPNARPKAQTAGKCSNQSCYVAALAASSKEPYQLKNGKKPTGGNASGDACIKRHYKELGLPAPAGLKRYLAELGDLDLDFDWTSAGAPSNDMMEIEKLALDVKQRRATLAMDMAEGNVEEELEKDIISMLGGSDNVETMDIDLSPEEAGNSTTLEKRQGSCKPNTVLFGRGTTEVGPMGGTVGPGLAGALKGAQFDVTGISYSADLPGIYCLGMTGGLQCVKQMQQLNSRCPNTKIIASGYSQGAMVARICVSWVNEKTRKQVAGLALFGDPFNGATVKGMPQERIKTWCARGDGVCNGLFSIGVAHMAYAGNGDVGKAAAWIKDIVKQPLPSGGGAEE